MAEPQHDFGGVLSFCTTANGTYTPLPELREFDGGDFWSVNIIKRKLVGAANKRIKKMAGQKDNGPFTATCEFMKANYATLAAAALAETKLFWKIASLNVDLWGPTQGLISKLTRPKMGADEVYQYQFTVEPSDADETFTAAS